MLFWQTTVNYCKQLQTTANKVPGGLDALLAEMLSLIRKEMQVQGMTLGDLARESKLGLRTVERYFSPALKSPEWYTLEQLARGVGKTLCHIQRRAHLRLLPPHKA